MARIPTSPRPSLDIRDLELVVALAASGSTVRAGASLHLTQSAVSRGLALAEQRAGVKLFDRNARGLTPTSAGTRLVEGAGAVLAQLALLEASVRSEEEKAPPMRLVCECYTAYRWLPSTLARLRRASDELNVELPLEHTRSPVEALLDDQVDVALLTTAVLPAKARSKYEERPLFSDEIVFVVSDHHPLASRSVLGVKDLHAYPLITSSQTPGPEHDWFLKRVFGKKAPRFELPALRFPLTEAIVDAARAGMGIAILSEWMASPYLESSNSGLVAKRLRGKPIARPWRIAFRRDLGDAPMRLAAAIEHAPPRVYLVKKTA